MAAPLDGMIPGRGHDPDFLQEHALIPPPSSSHDAIDALIQRCLGGDQGAWEEIVRQHRRKVFNIAYKFTGTPRRGRGPHAGHLPEDLQVAEHVRPPRQLPDLAGQRQPQPLHRSLPQRPQGTRDDRPRRGRRRADAGRRHGQSAYQALEQRDRVVLLRKAMAELPPTLRTAVLLRDIQEMSYQEIADQLGPAGRHREVAHQSRTHRTGAPDQRLREQDERVTG